MYVCILRHTSNACIRHQTTCDSLKVVSPSVLSCFATCSDHGYSEYFLKSPEMSEDKDDRLRTGKN